MFGGQTSRPGPCNDNADIETEGRKVYSDDVDLDGDENNTFG